jgi:gas vesicle protein
VGQLSPASCFAKALSQKNKSAFNTEYLWHGLRFLRKRDHSIHHGRIAMGHEHDQCSTSNTALAFLAGAIVGALAGILLAPKSGTEARRSIKDYADKTEHDILEKAKEARAALNELIEQGQRFVAEKQADVEAAVKAGREAMKARSKSGAQDAP